eukprot:jgi/Pico_ML_1/53842/g4314.t1
MESASNATFELEDEDHTLANSLRLMLNGNPAVYFCGYSSPHPSQRLVNLRVQCAPSETAKHALKTAFDDLREANRHVLDVFEKSIQDFEENEMKE